MDALVGLLIIGGVAAWYFKGKSEKNINFKSTPKQPAKKTSSGSKLRTRSNASNEERIAALHREATEHKGNDWQKAIACLREANTLVLSVKTSYPIKHFLRLPLFLQQAGDFKAAMREFHVLIDCTEKRIAKDYAHQNKTSRTMLAHADYSQIYASMAVAAKREGLAGEAEEYREKSEDHKATHAKMLKADMARREKRTNNP